MAVALIAYSGLSNVGRLSNAVAQYVLIRRPGRIEWVRAQAGPDAIGDAVDGAEIMIALAGLLLAVWCRVQQGQIRRVARLAGG